MQEKLVITSNKEHIVLTVIYALVAIPVIFIAIDMIVEAYEYAIKLKGDTGIGLFFIFLWLIIIFLVIHMVIGEWVGSNRTIIMNKNGCFIRFLNVEIKSRRLQDCLKFMP